MDDNNFTLLLSLAACSWLIQGSAPEVSFVGLPAVASVAENSPAGTSAYGFRVVLSSGVTIATGFPRILNSDPITDAFVVSMVNSTHAQVSVTGTSRLDFEASPNRFVFQVLAVDSAEDTDLQTLTVVLTDVDEPPVFLDQESLLYVVEKSPPGDIYTPTVSDPEKRPLTFTLNPAASGFDIDVASGRIFTTERFDYQTDRRSYAFNLTASDGTNAASRALLVNIVDLHDDTPRFLNTVTSFVIPEELSPGSVVANVTAVVPDHSPYAGFIFYTISSNDYLAIHRYTGLVTVGNRMDRDVAPLRDNPAVTVTVTATYRPSVRPFSSAITLTFAVEDVNDNPPVCAAGARRVEVLETEKVGALVTTVTCTDNDVEPAFTQVQLADLSCLGMGCNLRFALVSNRILLDGSLDFEPPSNLSIESEYSLLVEATDKNDTTLKGRAYVYVTVTPVNEFPPVFSHTSYFYSVSELLGRGSVIGVVSASDRDLPPASLRYSIASGGGSGGLSTIFSLDPELGSISLLTRPDYETTQNYRLVVMAVDGDPVRPRSAFTTVIVNITEANDEPPLCGPNKTNLVVPKDLRVGSNVQGFLLSCTDRDSPPASFIYSILGASNLNNHFVLSPSSGTNVTRLVLREPFDFESGLDRAWHYSLTVLVSDGNLRARGGGPEPAAALTQTGTVVINILVVDPNPTTTVATTTAPRVTYISIAENTFDVDGWYVWLFMVLGAMLLLGLLGYALYLLCAWLSTKDCSCCEPSPAQDKGTPDPAPPKKEIFVEVTRFNTVFDGEEVDPVTKRVYEYNSKSGARRWKDTGIASESLPQPDDGNSVVPETSGSHRSASSQSAARTGGGGRAGTGLSQTRSEGEGRAAEDQGGSPRHAVGREPSRQPAVSSVRSAGGVGLTLPNARLGATGTSDV